MRALENRIYHLRLALQKSACLEQAVYARGVYEVYRLYLSFVNCISVGKIRQCYYIMGDCLGKESRHEEEIIK